LKGFSDKYSLHNYPTVNGRVIKHLMISPSGLVVIESNDTLGPVSCNGDKWKARAGLLARFSGVNTPVGNPTAEVQAGVQAASEVLALMGKPDVAVSGLVLFTRATDIEVNECTYAAAPMGEAKNALRSVLAGMEPEREERSSVKSILTSEDRRKLNQLLAPEKSVPPAKPSVARSQARNQ
jgi:hypothetical protein